MAYVLPTTLLRQPEVRCNRRCCSNPQARCNTCCCNKDATQRNTVQATWSHDPPHLKCMMPYSGKHLHTWHYMSAHLTWSILSPCLFFKKKGRDMYQCFDKPCLLNMPHLYICWYQAYSSLSRVGFWLCVLLWFFGLAAWAYEHFPSTQLRYACESCDSRRKIRPLLRRRASFSERFQEQRRQNRAAAFCAPSTKQ